MAEIIHITFRLRRNTSVQWAELNPILDQGEPGFESDTGRLKVGDGLSEWNELIYLTSGDPVPGGDGASDAAVLAHINSLLPHPVYDDGPSLVLLYQNAKV